jgi:hypothetical protein
VYGTGDIEAMLRKAGRGYVRKREADTLASELQ